MGRAGKAWFEREFTVDKYRQKISRFYKDIIIYILGATFDT